jgi:hypothetical protein
MRMKASCIATANAGDWDLMVRSVGFEVSEQEAGSPFPDAAMTLVSNPWKAGTPVVHVSVHPAGKGEYRRNGKTRVDAHWSFSFQISPKDPPPVGLVTASAKAGDYPGGLTCLGEHWPLSAKPISWKVSAVFEIDPRVYALADTIVKSKPKSVVLRTKPAKMVIRPQGITWNLLKGKQEYSVVVQYPEPGQPTTLFLAGNFSTRISNELFDDLGDKLWQVLNPLITAK